MTASTQQNLEGGCACGAIRYRLAAPPRESGYCHCRICQRTSGAPVLVFATVGLAELKFEQGAPQVWRSTDFGERCIANSVAPNSLCMSLTSLTPSISRWRPLDAPCRTPPTFHIWTESQAPWFEIDDDFPRYAKSRRDSKPQLRRARS